MQSCYSVSVMAGLVHYTVVPFIYHALSPSSSVWLEFRLKKQFFLLIF